MPLDLPALLQSLARERPIFHNEADFQHALAWKLQQQHPEATIRLEHRPPELAVRSYIDILMRSEQGEWAVELKYKTRSLQINTNDEQFDLLDQSAHDHGRYDFCHDLARLEQLCAARARLRGYAVLLTNDPGYWSPSRKPGTVDAGFRLHEGITLHGRLAWSSSAAAGTTDGRVNPIDLRGRYDLNWLSYSSCAATQRGTFRMLVVPTQAYQG